MTAAARLAHRQLVRRLARRSASACVVIAVIMCAVAAAFLALLAADAPLARGTLIVPWAVLELLLTVWNLLVYIEKARIRDERRGRRAARAR